ncbi:MAG: hypothetical protein IJ563_07940 [Selenomonadaceae bacterium]|nr:hypothetical protein [Selenomonadaceae bacterium]MBR1859262.1 hypothetical protein [Selenomonadaceae bacterium]
MQIKKIIMTMLMVLAMTTAVFAAPAAQSNIDYEFVPLAYDSYDSSDFRGKADYYVIVNCRQWVIDHQFMVTI